jgi:hypothetical protein
MEVTQPRRGLQGWEGRDGLGPAFRYQGQGGAHSKQAARSVSRRRRDSRTSRSPEPRHNSNRPVRRSPWRLFVAVGPPILTVVRHPLADPAPTSTI